MKANKNVPPLATSKEKESTNLAVFLSSLVVHKFAEENQLAGGEDSSVQVLQQLLQAGQLVFVKCEGRAYQAQQYQTLHCPRGLAEFR